MQPTALMKLTSHQKPLFTSEVPPFHHIRSYPAHQSTLKTEYPDSLYHMKVSPSPQSPFITESSYYIRVSKTQSPLMNTAPLNYKDPSSYHSLTFWLCQQRVEGEAGLKEVDFHTLLNAGGISAIHLPWIKWQVVANTIATNNSLCPRMSIYGAGGQPVNAADPGQTESCACGSPGKHK